MTTIEHRTSAIALLCSRDGLRNAAPVFFTALAFWAGWVLL